MTSLLKQALKLKKNNRHTIKRDRLPIKEQEKRLILAWLDNKIGWREARVVMKRDGHNLYSRAFVILRRMREEGRIKFLW